MGLKGWSYKELLPYAFETGLAVDMVDDRKSQIFQEVGGVCA